MPKVLMLDRGRRGVARGDVPVPAAARGGVRGRHRRALEEEAPVRRPRLRRGLRHLHGEARLHVGRRPRVRGRGSVRLRRARGPRRPRARVHPQRRRRAADHPALLRRREAGRAALPRAARAGRGRGARGPPHRRLPGARARRRAAGAEFVDGAGRRRRHDGLGARVARPSGVDARVHEACCASTRRWRREEVAAV